MSKIDNWTEQPSTAPSVFADLVRHKCPLPDTAVTVRCHNKLHKILVTSSGKLVLLNHKLVDGYDPHAVAASLTTNKSRCLEILDTWRNFYKRNYVSAVAKLPTELLYCRWMLHNTSTRRKAATCRLNSRFSNPYTSYKCWKSMPPAAPGTMEQSCINYHRTIAVTSEIFYDVFFNNWPHVTIGCDCECACRISFVPTEYEYLTTPPTAKAADKAADKAAIIALTRRWLKWVNTIQRPIYTSDVCHSYTVHLPIDWVPRIHARKLSFIDGSIILEIPALGKVSINSNYPPGSLAAFALSPYRTCAVNNSTLDLSCKAVLVPANTSSGYSLFWDHTWRYNDS